MLRDELVPALLAGRRSGVVGHPMATAAVATALADAALRSVERSLAAELASAVDGSATAAVARTAVVGLSDGVDEAVAAVGAALEHRPAAIKLKATPRAVHLQALEAVRSTWPDLPLAVDFNGTADLDAVRRVDRLAPLYIEQPAPAAALVTSAHLQGMVDAPIALDESIRDDGDLDSAVALAAGRIVNVKPARCGGPHRAATLIAAVRHAGLDAFVGGMVESGVGRAAALAVAALPGLVLPTDLGPSAAYVDRDLARPIEADDDGRTVVPDGPGIGRTPDPEALAAMAVEHLDLGRTAP